MKYEKPEIVASAAAVRLIQNRQCPKGNGQLDSEECRPLGPRTPSAYTADE